MAALSDYLESGLLHHILGDETFAKPSTISIALTSTAPVDSDTGASIPEIPSGINGSGTGYARVDLGPPASSGASAWDYLTADSAVGSGVFKNASNILFTTALLDWGWASGVAVVDHSTYGSGNLLFHGQLGNPRVIYAGDAMKFDLQTLKIQIK